MFNWYREWLQIRREARICDSCETLKHQLEVANFEKKQLLDRLLEKPTIPEPVKEPVMVTKPTSVPWAVRRHMLEAEDREKARLLRDAPKPSTEDLEKELDLASKEREAKTS